jgi:excisionase family DNA binding protein
MEGIMTDPAVTRLEDLPYFLTAREVATLLRTTLKAVYADVARNRLPGVVRHGRRLLFRRDVLLGYLGEKRAPSPGGSRR